MWVTRIKKKKSAKSFQKTSSITRVVSRTFLFLYKTFILLALPARLSLISLNLHPKREYRQSPPLLPVPFLLLLQNPLLLSNLTPESTSEPSSSSTPPSSPPFPSRSPASQLPHPLARVCAPDLPLHPSTSPPQVYLCGRHEIFQSPLQDNYAATYRHFRPVGHNLSGKRPMYYSFFKARPGTGGLCRGYYSDAIKLLTFEL